MGAIGKIQIKVRAVTDDEVRFLWENGWVKLPELVSREDAAIMLAQAQQMMGADGAALVEQKSELDGVGWFQDYEMASADNDVLRQYVRNEQLGLNSARLLGRDTAIRAIVDTLAVKLPTSNATHGSDASPFHQDQTLHPWDRHSVSFWLALDEVRPDQGPLQFYSGSQKLGQLGGASTLFDYPRLLAECPLTEPDHLLPGDATAHMSGVVHGAAQNVGRNPRWGFISAYLPADARYSGRPSRYTDGLGLEIGKPLDHPRFPIISEAWTSQRSGHLFGNLPGQT